MNHSIAECLVVTVTAHSEQLAKCVLSLCMQVVEPAIFLENTIAAI